MNLMELYEAVAGRFPIYNINWIDRKMYIVLNEDGDYFINHHGEPHPNPIFQMPEDWKKWTRQKIEDVEDFGQTPQLSLEQAHEKLEANLIIALRSFGETLSKNLSTQVVEELRRHVGITISRKP